MMWLLWREYRLNRLILISGLAVSLTPYVTGVVKLSWWIPRGWQTSWQIVGVFSEAAFYSLVCFQLTMAVLGGNAIAGERADRSAEFLVYLPLSRPRRVASKLILTLATMLVFWSVNLVVLLLPPNLLLEADAVFLGPADIIFGYVAITGLTFFSVGWLISSLQSSPTFAICGGLMTPLVIFLCLCGAWAAYGITCTVIAVVCFSIGTWYYLGRVEP
jgi:ABC-type transport system involved in multi-copper enzyme maturation permease subunit